jgi:hypothetical protein
MSESDDTLVIERDKNGNPTFSVITDLEAFKKRMSEKVNHAGDPLHPNGKIEPHRIPSIEGVNDQVKSKSVYVETYEMKRQQVIAACPFRSYKKYSTVDGKLNVEHLFRDGGPAEGCGCSTMKCQLGKGDNGNVTVDQCTACVTEAGLLGQEIPIQPPSVYQKIKNFGRAAAVHIIKGMPRASAAQQEERLAICRSCEYHKEGICTICGCSLSLKTQWANNHAL